MEIADKITKFISTHPNPEDEDVHEFAESLGMEPSELEDEIYSVLTDYVLEMVEGGKADQMSNKDFDAEQLARGILIELEHTKNFDTALEIAKDHLTEYEDYYVELEKMEKELERKSRSDFYDRMKIITGQARVKIDYEDKEYSLHPEFDDYIETGADIHDKNFMPIIFKNQVVGGINAEQRGEAIIVEFIATVPAMGKKGIAREAVSLLFEKFPSASYIIGDSKLSARGFWQGLGAEFENDIFVLRRSGAMDKDSKIDIKDFIDKIIPDLLSDNMTERMVAYRSLKDLGESAIPYLEKYLGTEYGGSVQLVIKSIKHEKSKGGTMRKDALVYDGKEFDNPYLAEGWDDEIREVLNKWAGQFDDIKDEEGNIQLIIDTVISGYSNAMEDAISILDGFGLIEEGEREEAYEWALDELENVYDVVADEINKYFSIPGHLYFMWHEGGFYLFYTVDDEGLKEMGFVEEGSPPTRASKLRSNNV